MDRLNNGHLVCQRRVVLRIGISLHVLEGDRTSRFTILDGHCRNRIIRRVVVAIDLNRQQIISEELHVMNNPIFSISARGPIAATVATISAPPLCTQSGLGPKDRQLIPY